MEGKVISDTSAKSEDDKKRLDPFILPSETNGRFLMLIFAAVLLVWHLSSVLITVTGFRLDANQDIEAMLQAFHRIAEYVDEGEYIWDLTDEEIANLASDLEDIQMKALTSGLYRVIVPFLVTLIFLGLTAFIYLLHPSLLNRRHKTEPLDKDNASSVFSYIHCVTKAMNLPSRLKIIVKPTASSIPPKGLTFGLHKQETLMLYGKSANLERDWQRYPIVKRFEQTVILHELGHIVNKDMSRYYFAGATWIAFVLISILFLIALPALSILASIPLPTNESGTFGLPTPRLLIVVFQVFLTIGFVYFILKGFIRIREYYADWRADLWGNHQSLHDYLELLKEIPWHQRIRKAHPDPRARRSAIENPTKNLFRLSSDLPVLSGFLLAIVGVGLTFLAIFVYFSLSQAKEVLIWRFVQQLDLSLAYNRLLFRLTMIARLFLDIVPLILIILPVPYLVVRTLGVQVQRDLIADLHEQSNNLGSYLRLILPAFLFALGVEFGFLIIPLSPLSAAFSPSLFLIPIWLLGFTVLTWFWLIYVRALTQLLLGTATKLPKYTRYLITLSLILLLWILYVPAFFSRLAIQVVGQQPLSGFFPPSVDGTQYLFMMFGFTVLVLIAISLLFLFWFFASLIGVGFYLIVRPPQCCPECGKKASPIFVVGETCEFCDQDLAPWIYARSRSEVLCS